MNTKIHLLKNEDGSQTMVFGPSGEAKSMLSDLTPGETADMMVWSEQQPRNPAGSVDLMGWPGWEGVMARRFKQRFGVEMTKCTS